jgi:hypothetical protein
MAKRNQQWERSGKDNNRPKRKEKEPGVLSRILLGPELANIKANKPGQWKRIQAAARKRGVTVPALVNGGPVSLMEKSPRGIRREASKTAASLYKPERQALNRRQQANQNLAESQRQAEEEFQRWLEGQVGTLRAQAGAADAALASTHTKINQEIGAAQAAATADLTSKLTSAHLAPDLMASPAVVAPLAEAQALQLGRQRIAQEHSAALQAIGDSQLETGNAALIGQAAVRGAQYRADQNERSAQLVADRRDVTTRQRGTQAEIAQGLRQANVELANSNREFNLAAQQLGLKQSELALDRKKARQDYKIELKKFDLTQWVAKNKVKADRLKRQIEYDKLASREGIEAANRALRREIAREQQAGADRRDRNNGGSGGATATERAKSQTAYQDVETARTILAAKLARGMSEREARLEAIRKNGMSNVLIDVALEINRHNGAVTDAAVRKAKALGILNPRRLWDPYKAPVAGQGH